MASKNEGGAGMRRLVGPAVALAAAGAAAGALAAQHRAVRRAIAQARSQTGAQDLELPDDLVHREITTHDGARLHVVERGQGPTMLLLHGMLLSSDIWVHQLTDLADRHRVVAVDLRGHGRSTAGQRPIDIATMADDVHQVVDALGLSGCLLVGHSMGGMVALHLAQHLAESAHPECLSGVALISSAAGPFVKMPGWRGITRRGAPVWSSLALVAEQAGAWAAPAEDLRWWLIRIGFGPEAVPAQVRFTERIQAATPAGTLTQVLPVLAGLDLSAGLVDVDLPVLVVVGTHDRLTPPRYARRIAHGLANGQLVELPRCGHMPMLERRREFSRLLDEFCEKVS